MEGAAAGPPWTVRQALRSPVALGLLLAALALRLAYGAVAVTAEKDGANYDALALSIAEHGEYRLVGDEGLPYRSPGYPLFLAGIYRAVGFRHGAVRVVQCLLDLVMGAFVLALGHALGLQRGVALLGMGIALLNPFTLACSAMILSETLATFLVTAAVLLLLSVARVEGGRRIAYSLAFGAVASAAALTRPSFALLPVPLLVVVLVTRQLTGRRWMQVSALALAGFVAVWLPWALRNAIVLRAFLPYNAATIQRPGYNGWVGTWALTMQDIYAAVWEAPVHPPPRAYEDETERREVEALLAERTAAEAAPTADAAKLEAIDRRFVEIKEARVARHPFRHYLILPFARCFTMWFLGNASFLAQANVPLGEMRRALTERPLALSAKVLSLVLWDALPVLAVLGWWGRRRTHALAASLPVVVAVYCTLMTVAITVLRPAFQVWMEPRYVLESVPALAPLVATGAGAVWARLRGARPAGGAAGGLAGRPGRAL
jgi:4-amino-4-deoxy-L-arabinose transferase-like glycosyltransferase